MDKTVQKRDAWIWTFVNYINFEGSFAKAIVPLQDCNVNHAPCPRTVAPNRDRADSQPFRDRAFATLRARKLLEIHLSSTRSPSLKSFRGNRSRNAVERGRSSRWRVVRRLVNRDKRKPALFRGTEITGWFSREKFRTRFLQWLKKYTRKIRLACSSCF